MRSYQSFTTEIDDIDAVIAKFKSEIYSQKLLKNSCGIIFSSNETNGEELVSKLTETFDFPFIGCSGIGMLNSEGYADEQISFLLLTADDCEFSVALSEDLGGKDLEPALRSAYDRASSALSEKEKLIISYIPWSIDISYDNVVAVLDKLGDKVPIFGGVASDTWTFVDSFVFTNGKLSKNGAVLLMISGEITPVLKTEQSVVPVSRTRGKITKASGKFVYEIDGLSATDYLANKGVLPTKVSAVDGFLVSPFIIIGEKDGETISGLRTLDYIDFEKGACRFVGNVEEGSDIMLSYISKDEMGKSVERFLGGIIDLMKKGGEGRYSTILCSSCATRYSLIVADKETEAKGYLGKLPDFVNFQGIYLFGEFCPATGGKSGKYYNRFNNETFAILAF